MGITDKQEMKRLRGVNHDLCDALERTLEREKALVIERDAALEREQALVNQLASLADGLEAAEAYSAEAGYMWDASECAEWIREQSPANTLANYTLIKQADALDDCANALDQCGYGAAAQGTRVRAKAKRQQAAAL